MISLRAIYVDGEMIPAQKGASADPKPCAGNDGTTVTVCGLDHLTCLSPHSLYMRMCPLGRESVLQRACAFFCAPKFI